MSMQTILLALALGGSTAADQAGETMIIGLYEPRVCASHGPLADNCEFSVDLPLDASSPTGYSIPHSVQESLDLIDTSIRPDLKHLLWNYSLYESNGPACGSKCAIYPVSDLSRLLYSAWGVRTCNSLTNDFVRRGVYPKPDIYFDVLAYYSETHVIGRLDDKAPGYFLNKMRSRYPDRQTFGFDDLFVFLKDEGFVRTESMDAYDTVLCLH